MKIEIKRLIIDNFKGITHLDIDLDGANANIYGANGTGKTSIQDAYCWLMYNKDSKGRTDFAIKPLNSMGEVANHGAESSVIGHISFDGKPMTFKKIYREKWSQKRGNAEATFDGNTSEYFIDDLPVTKARYDASINELCPEKAFRLLSDLTYFNEQLDWRDRRNILLEMADPTKAERLLSDPKYIDLKLDMGEHSVDDYKKILTSKRKELNTAKAKIPGRLDECNKAVSDLTGIDFDGLKAESIMLEMQIEKLKKQLIDIDTDTATQSLQNQINSLSNELKALEIENEAYRKSQIDNGLETKRHSLSEVISIYSHEKSSAETLLAKAITESGDTQTKIQKAREEWQHTNAEAFDEKMAICPTCGREYDTDAKSKIENNFKKDKKARLDAIAQRAVSLKELAARLEDDIARYSKKIEESDNVMRAKMAELEKLTESPAEIKNLDEYSVTAEQIKAEQIKLTKELNELIADKSTVKSQVKAELVRLKARADYIASELAKKSSIQHFNNRISELNDEASMYTAQINELDRMMYLAEQYTTERAAIVENGVNSLFKHTKFKLYDTQVNGAIVDMCEATYNGISYSGTLNSGHCVMVALDIINTLSGYYNISVPLFFDNAEKYTGKTDISTQVIKMTVTDTDKKIRIEKENKNEFNSKEETGLGHTAA